MPGHLTKALVNQWATDAYIAGYQAGSGTDDAPQDIDVSIFDPRKNGKMSQITKRNQINHEERSNLDYDPCKCDARVWNHGYGAQCSRKKVDGEILCVSCLKKHEDLQSKGLQLAFGLITGERPLVSLDKEDGNDLSGLWKDLKKEKALAPKRLRVPLDILEVREYLDSRGTSLDGYNGKEVFQLYEKEKRIETIENAGWRYV